MVLVMAGELAGVDVESDHRGRIEVVPGAGVSRPWAAVARTPVRESGRRIVGTCDPHRHAAGLPCVAGPGLATRFSRCGYGIGLPRRFTGGGVEGGDETANAELAARHADHDLAGRHQRRQGHVVAGTVILDLRLPDDPAGNGIEGDHVAVRSRHEHQSAVQAHAPVRGMHLPKVFRQVALVAPQLLARRRVERNHVVVRGGDEHPAVVDHGWRLVAFAQPRGEGPQRLQALDVVDVDLGERTVAVGVEGAPVHEPIGGLGVDETGVRYGSVLLAQGEGSGECQPTQQEDSEESHDSSPALLPCNHGA